MYKSRIEKYRVIIQYKYVNRKPLRTGKRVIESGNIFKDNIDEEFSDIESMLSFITMHKPDAYTNGSYKVIRYDIAVMRFTVTTNMVWAWVDHTEQFVPDEFLVKSDLYRRQHSGEDDGST